MKIFNLLVVGIGLVVSTLCSHTIQARSYDDIIESKQITVAIYRDYPPFSYQQDGIAHGIDIDIARHIAKEMDVELRLRWMTADENVEDDLRNNLWKGHYLKRTVADLMLRVPYAKIIPSPVTILVNWCMNRYTCLPPTILNLGKLFTTTAR